MTLLQFIVVLHSQTVVLKAFVCVPLENNAKNSEGVDLHVFIMIFVVDI